MAVYAQGLRNTESLKQVELGRRGKKKDFICLSSRKSTWQNWTRIMLQMFQLDSLLRRRLDLLTRLSFIWVRLSKERE